MSVCSWIRRLFGGGESREQQVASYVARLDEAVAPLYERMADANMAIVAWRAGAITDEQLKEVVHRVLEASRAAREAVGKIARTPDTGEKGAVQ